VTSPNASVLVEEEERLCSGHAPQFGREAAFAEENATSFAVMERLALRKAFAFDPHFRRYGSGCRSRRDLTTAGSESSLPIARRRRLMLQ